MGQNSPLVVHHGGGVNSTALLLGLKDRHIIPDLILFADTGSEKPQTYEFLDRLNLYISDIGFPRITYVRYSGKDNSLEDECLRSLTLPSKAYGYKRCSQKWKIDPQNRYISRWAPAKAIWSDGGSITSAIGFDAGEERRLKESSDARVVFWYPLFEWGWGREECIDRIEQSGLPVPVKSACFFCPSSRKVEVKSLARNHPDLFQRAVQMESAVLETGTLINIQGLGRHWSWKGLIDGIQFDTDAPESIDIECACFDGDDE